MASSSRENNIDKKEETSTGKETAKEVIRYYDVNSKKPPDPSQCIVSNRPQSSNPFFDHLTAYTPDQFNFIESTVTFAWNTDLGQTNLCRYFYNNIFMFSLPMCETVFDAQDTNRFLNQLITQRETLKALKVHVQDFRLAMTFERRKTEELTNDLRKSQEQLTIARGERNQARLDLSNEKREIQTLRNHLSSQARRIESDMEKLGNKIHENQKLTQEVEALKYQLSKAFQNSTLNVLTHMPREEHEARIKDYTSTLQKRIVFLQQEVALKNNYITASTSESSIPLNKNDKEQTKNQIRFLGKYIEDLLKEDSLKENRIKELEEELRDLLSRYTSAKERDQLLQDISKKNIDNAKLKRDLDIVKGEVEDQKRFIKEKERHQKKDKELAEKLRREVDELKGRIVELEQERISSEFVIKNMYKHFHPLIGLVRRFIRIRPSTTYPPKNNNDLPPTYSRELLETIYKFFAEEINEDKPFSVWSQVMKIFQTLVVIIRCHHQHHGLNPRYFTKRHAILLKSRKSANDHSLSQGTICTNKVILPKSPLQNDRGDFLLEEESSEEESYSSSEEESSEGDDDNHDEQSRVSDAGESDAEGPSHGDSDAEDPDEEDHDSESSDEENPDNNNKENPDNNNKENPDNNNKENPDNNNNKENSVHIHNDSNLTSSHLSSNNSPRNQKHVETKPDKVDPEVEPPPKRLRSRSPRR